MEAGLAIEAPPTTELQELLRSIIEAITSLLKLSIVIRNPLPRDRYAKSAGMPPLNSSYDIAHVRHKYPKTEGTGAEGEVKDDWLLKRLGKAITSRRQFLRYRRDHREKLSRPSRNVEKREGVSKPQPRFDASGWVETSSRATRTVISDVAPSSTLPQTKASTYVTDDSEDKIEELSDAGQSESSYATTVSEEADSILLVPPMPKEAADEVPFECPYCFTIQTVIDYSAWK